MIETHKEKKKKKAPPKLMMQPKALAFATCFKLRRFAKLLERERENEKEREREWKTFDSLIFMVLELYYVYTFFFFCETAYVSRYYIL